MKNKEELRVKIVIIGALELLFVLMYILMSKVNFIVGTVMIFIYVALLINVLIQTAVEQLRLEKEVEELEEIIMEMKKYEF